MPTIEPDLEDRVLELAFKRGNLSHGDLSPAPAPLSCASGLSQGHLYGPRLDSLIRRGCIAEHIVRNLMTEFAAQQDTQDGLAPGALPEAATPPPGSGIGAPLEVPAFLLTWERYFIEACLGRGGMGIVYKAWDRKLGRAVAIKFMHDATAHAAQRFLREARAQARISHLAVCQVYEVGEHAGLPYIAMEYLPGQPLNLAAARMSLEEKVLLMRDVASALQAAHGLGIIHRDVKPQNILVSHRDDGRWHAKVLDFGLARDFTATQDLTESGAVLGTPAYMPPEQARGEVTKLDRRADVYSLGAVMYHLLAGEPPFAGTSLGEVLVQVMNEEPISLRQHSPHLPADLEAITMKCLRKEVQLRYESAQALVDDLDRYLAGEKVQAAKWSWAYRLRRRARRNRGLLGVGLAALVCLGGALGMTVRSQQLADRRARLAHELGREIELNEMFLRAAYMMPLHNAGVEQETVRTRVHGIEKQLMTMSRAEAALAHHALGRAYLALREYGRAVEHLQAALRADPATEGAHYYLGLALGEQYKLALREVERQGDPSWRARRASELRREFLQPAQEHFGKSDTARLESPDYAEAAQAFFNHDYELARRKADAAHARQPWRVESQRLIGDIHYSRGMDLIEHAAYPEARSAITQAVAHYQAAAAVARSDAATHLAEADAWVKQAQLDMLQGAAPEAAFAQALTACARARAADPDLDGLYQIEYFVNFGKSYYLLEHGLDPAPALQAAAAAAARGMDRRPRDPFFYDAVSTIWLRQAHTILQHGGDATALLQKAEIYLKRAIELNPNMARTWHSRGSLYGMMCMQRLAKGLDAEPQLQAAVADFTTARQLGPQQFAANELLFLLLVEYARSLVARRQPPWPILRQAQRWLAEAERLDVVNFKLHQSMADLYAMTAEYELALHQSPDAELTAALAELAAAQALNANAAESFRALAWVNRLRACAARDRGEPSGGLLAAALSAAERSLRINPADPAARRERAAIVAEGARLRDATGSDAQANTQRGKR